MSCYQIRFRDVMDVKEFVNLLTPLAGTATLRQEDREADAKSIMSIFALDITEEFVLELETEPEEETIQSLAPYLA